MPKTKEELSLMSKDELKALQNTILQRCKMWESCKDGSHGMALSLNGFYDISKELKKRRTSK
jgi:hypothetical protein